MDPYAPCPCGSGKKVKFCCQKLVPEMEKIERLQDNQPQLAIQHLEKLEEKYPGNPWVVTTKAATLMQEHRYQEAKIALLKFLREHPDHPRANALYAFASLNVDGFPACKKAVHRAFKRCVAESPRIVSALMEALGEQYLIQGKILAARAHFVLATRIAVTLEDRERLLSAILRIDSDPSIPFPLRGGHPLPPYDPPAAAKEAMEKSRRLSLLACWEEAATLMDQAAAHDGNSAAVWHTIGLYRAWDGDEAAAAAALHKAAKLYSDEVTAVECETIAQLLDQQDAAGSRAVRMKRYKLASVSQVLSKLDEQPRFVRSEEHSHTDPVAGDPVAVYLLLDRPLPPKEELDRLTPEDVPLYLGRLLVFDSSPEEDLPAMAFLTGLEGDELNSLETAFMQAAGDLASSLVDPERAPDAPADFDRDVLGRIALEELPLHRNYFVPPGSPGHVRRKVQDAHWKRLTEETWPNIAQKALGGKTPLQAADDSSLRAPLQAAVNVLDVFFDERAQMLPSAALRERLKLPAPPAPELESRTPVATLSGFELLRLDISRLTNRQLNELLERLSMSRHNRLLYQALEEFLSRDFQGEETFMPQEAAAAALMDLAMESRNLPEALRWAARGREFSRAGENAFERNLTWKLRELRLQVALGDIDDLRRLLTDLWANYGAKIPNLRDQLMQVVETLRIDPPWEQAIVTADSLSGATSWNPSLQPAGGEPAKKLWLPGQD